MARRRVARGGGGAGRLLALESARRRGARASRPPRPPALDDRARLPAAEGRTRARPLRGAKLPRLPPPLRARHLRARFPDARAPLPKSAAAGLTLPQAVLLCSPSCAVGTAAAVPARGRSSSISSCSSRGVSNKVLLQSI